MIWDMAMGAKNPGKLANILVIPMRVPAKFGAISMWLQFTELNWNPFIPTQAQSKIITIIIMGKK